MKNFEKKIIDHLFFNKNFLGISRLNNGSNANFSNQNKLTSKQPKVTILGGNIYIK